MKLKKSFFYGFLGVTFLSLTASLLMGFSWMAQSKLLKSHVQGQSQFEIEKVKLLSKIASLEASLKRIESSAEKLQSAVALETKNLNYGVGPLGDTKDFDNFLNRLRETSKETGQSPKSLSKSLSTKLDNLDQYAIALELKVQELYQAQSRRLNFWAASPSLWPVEGWVTSEFGYRYSPWARRVKMHEGIDVAAPYGTMVRAPSKAKVLFAGRKGGYGNTIILDHGFGIQSLYGHNSFLLVEEGDQVDRGQEIARVGSTGASTGPHLHYEVHVDGIPVDPMKYISE